MTKPVDMLLFCPRCHAQHIDEPHDGWSNPPHLTHTCQECGARFRYCDSVPANGVRSIAEPGRDVVPPAPAPFVVATFAPGSIKIPETWERVTPVVEAAIQLCATCSPQDPDLMALRQALITAELIDA